MQVVHQREREKRKQRIAKTGVVKSGIYNSIPDIPDNKLDQSFLVFLDIDECATSNGGCEHTCVNTFASFYCVCRQGFTLSSDNANCEGECYKYFFSKGKFIKYDKVGG